MARAMFLSQDRSDINFAMKELSRKNATSDIKNWAALKRLARYLIGKERAVTMFEWKEEMGDVEVCSDSDYAGCKETRKSTSGGMIKLGSHVIRHWSSTQACIALSSGPLRNLHACRCTSDEFLFLSALK